MSRQQSVIKYVYENMMKNGICSWRRAVRTYYFQQTRKNRRRNPDFTDADGSYYGEETVTWKAVL